MAYHAWRADLAAGADSILLAPTNDVINALNARARTDRLAADPAAAGAPTVVLADQLTRQRRGHHPHPKERALDPDRAQRLRPQRLPLHHHRSPDRWQPQSPPSAQRTHRHAARRLHRRARDAGLRGHHRLGPRLDRRPARHQGQLPHRRLGHADPPSPLRRDDPGHRRKPPLPVDRRGRPAPAAVAQGHPPRHRRRRPDPRRWPATAPKSRPPPQPAKPPTPPRGWRPQQTCTTTRWVRRPRTASAPVPGIDSTPSPMR